MRIYGRGIFRRLTLIATHWPLRYYSGDARHQSSTERRQQQLCAFCRSWDHASFDLCSSYGGGILFGRAFGYATSVPAGWVGGRVRWRDVLRVPGAPEVGRMMGGHRQQTNRCGGWIVVMMVPVAAVLQ